MNTLFVDMQLLPGSQSYHRNLESSLAMICLAMYDFALLGRHFVDKKPYKVCMSLEVQKLLLQGHINRMYDESDVDHRSDNFQVLLNLNKADEHLKEVELYCLEVNREISELESYSKLAKINFLGANKIARSIKERSVCIGALNVRRATIFVIDACLGFHDESYSQAVDGLRNDFMSTKDKFETYMKMVRVVLEKEKEQKKIQK